MSRLFHDFYVQPMYQVYIETIAIYLIWIVAMLLLRGKVRRIVAIVGTVLAFVLILLFTVLFRSGEGTLELSLIPLISFKNAKIEPELYRTMYMNMLLFMPLGLSLPFAISDKSKHNILFTILVGSLLSVMIEICQFVFFIGRCETDDVIMNTLGVLIGSTSLLVVRAIKGSKS